jgi:hypothetical protein
MKTPPRGCAVLIQRLSIASCHRALLHLIGLAVLLAATPVQALQPQVLLVFDPAEPLSALDAAGIRAALVEQQIPRIEFEHGLANPISPAQLQQHAAIVLAHVDLQAGERLAVEAYLQSGGGVLATGRSGLGLEATLGVGPLQTLLRNGSTEIRLQNAHPVATGSFWSGPISQTPPMPAEELPGIQQLFYLDPDWPAYTAQPVQAQVLARWRRAEAIWSSTDGSPAVFAHQAGAGRAVYLGALPGVYVDPDWNYPLAWRTLISEALSWVNTRGALIQLGYWPQGKRAAFAYSADTERAQMATVVPALLAIFDALGLQRFGTFFIVGQAGGDPGTEGAVEHPQVVSQILSAGAELAGHGDVHLRFQNQDLPTQRARLQAMRGLIEPLMGAAAPLLGFRGPALAVDRNTWRALAAEGLVYDSSDQDVWSEWSLPWFTGEVWELPPSSLMDYRLMVEMGLSGAEWEVLLRDKLAFIASRRGLFNWITHPWVIENELPRVEAMLRDARDRGDLWLARLDDILEWWLRREDLRVQVLESDAFRLRLQVDNLGDVPVQGASLWLRLPPAEYPWLATVDGAGTPMQPRPHGLGTPTAFEVVVISQIAASANALVELRVDRPVGVFADGFEG